LYLYTLTLAAFVPNITRLFIDIPPFVVHNTLQNILETELNKTKQSRMLWPGVSAACSLPVPQRLAHSAFIHCIILLLFHLLKLSDDDDDDSLWDLKLIINVN